MTYRIEICTACRQPVERNECCGTGKPHCIEHGFRGPDGTERIDVVPRQAVIDALAYNCAPMTAAATLRDVDHGVRPGR